MDQSTLFDAAIIVTMIVMFFVLRSDYMAKMAQLEESLRDKIWNDINNHRERVMRDMGSVHKLRQEVEGFQSGLDKLKEEIDLVERPESRKLNKRVKEATEKMEKAMRENATLESDLKKITNELYDFRFARKKLENQ